MGWRYRACVVLGTPFSRRRSEALAKAATDEMNHRSSHDRPERMEGGYALYCRILEEPACGGDLLVARPRPEMVHGVSNFDSSTVLVCIYCSSITINSILSTLQTTVTADTCFSHVCV